MKPAALQRLVRVVEARKAADLARVAKLMGAIAGIEAEIAALAERPTLDAAEGDMPLGMIGMRLAWLQAQIADRRRRRAALAEELDVARKAAQQSVGKHQALLHLAARAARDAAAAGERAAERSAEALRPHRQV